MFKRYLMVLSMLLALPAFANAWIVNSKTSPASGSGTISPAGNVTYAAGVDSGAYTVTPVAGKKISRITVDGVNVGTTSPVFVNYTTGKTYRYVVAYFAAADTALFNITPTVIKDASNQARGAIREDTFESLKKIPAGSARQLLIIPNPGYTVGEVQVDGVVVTPAAIPFSNSKQYNFTNLQANHTISAAFVATTVVTAEAGQSVTTTGNDAAHAATLFGSATSTQNGATFTYAWTGPAELTFGTPAAASTTVYSTTPGTYTATLTVTSSLGGTGIDTAQVTVVSTVANDVALCAGCHNDNTPEIMTAYGASGHKSAGIACQTCHTDQPHTVLPNAADCAECHSSVSHGTAVSACSMCHDPHSALITPHPSAASRPDCATCHDTIAADFATSQHGTRQGKLTWYADNLSNPAADELQKGFGNYVNIAYAALPCGKCHNAAAWTPAGGTDQWLASTGGVSVCNDCHGNKSAGLDTTAINAPVTKTTCFGCHSRQANETAAGLTDVHFVAGMGCASCHSTTDMHGTGTQTASQLQWGTISAQCENCHGAGKSQGPISTIAAHTQHGNDIACSTCHAESMITCHNCHFDNEAAAGGATKAKFFSGRFGGTVASGNSWRFLVNRVMPDGTTKIYPGSMQSLAADYTVDNVDGAQIHTHAGIAPYYSHTITRVNALSCDKCHGTETAVKLAAGQPVRVTTWNAAAGVEVAYTAVQSTFIGPKGVIPVPENPKGKLLMDFVDLTNPGAALTADKKNSTSSRILLQKDGPDTIHMPEAYVKPLTVAQIQKLANPQFDHTSAVATSSASPSGFTANTCQGCHQSTNTVFAKSLHYTREGKATFYNATSSTNPVGDGFGKFVTVGYTALPCADCHNAAAWNTGGGDTWAAETGGNPVCTDCHTNKVAGAATTAFDAPVTKATCIGCHSRQANETSMGLTDVHTSGAVINGQTMNFTCSSCHAFSDLHGDGTAKASQLAPGAVTASCDNCHTSFVNAVPEHTQHIANIACSTCHMESVITCYGCHFDNEASDPADATILHAKFASGKFGGTAASGKSWRFLVNRVMADGSTKVYPASMQSLVADRTAANAPGEDNQGWTHAAIAPYYSHSITKVNALKCDKCHGIQKAIDLNNGTPVRVVKWNAAAGVEVPVSSMMATYTAPSGVIPVPENPVGKLLMDFVDLVNPAASPLNASGTSPSARVLFKADGPDTIHMPEAYVKPMTAAQIQKLATPQTRP